MWNIAPLSSQHPITLRLHQALLPTTALHSLSVIPSMNFHQFRSPKQEPMSTLPKTDRLNYYSPLSVSQRIFSPKRYSDVFDDMDEMVKNVRLSLKRSPPLSLWDGNIPKNNFDFECIPGFDVKEDDKAFTVTTRAPEHYEKKDLSLNFDHDKHMLRLTGKKHYKEGDMEVESSFEKAITLSHDIDDSQLDTALSDDGTLTITAPKKFAIDEYQQSSEATTAALEEDAAEDEIARSTGGMVA